MVCIKPTTTRQLGAPLRISPPQKASNFPDFWLEPSSASGEASTSLRSPRDEPQRAELKRRLVRTLRALKRRPNASSADIQQVEDAIALLETAPLFGFTARVDGREFSSPRELESALARTLKQARARLSDVDLQALDYYTGTESSVHYLSEKQYEFLNRSLRGRHTGDGRHTISDLERVAADSHRISAALKKLPTFEGTLWRGTFITDPKDIERYQVGSVVLENSYTSASFDPAKRFEGNVEFYYKAGKAAVVHTLSSVNSEREVLFDRFTKFYIRSRRYDERRKVWAIEAEQVEYDNE